MRDFKKDIDALRERCGRTPLALITGASSGMGVIYARELARAGCDLLLVSNQDAQLSQVASELAGAYGVRCLTRYQDLATETAADELFAWCQAEGLLVDILINNAGMFFFKELILPDDRARVETILALHVGTVTRLTLLHGNEMKKRGVGYILNVASMASAIPAPGLTLYAATKAYLKTFSQSLYFEFRPHGVGLTVVCPAAVATPLYRIKPELMAWGVRIGLIATPDWLVRRALRGMFRRKRVVRPGLTNYLIPCLVNALPNACVAAIWKKLTS
ncbi:MAG: SDR family NAD(P)-dependent oxidoreductase [Bacteroidales bacterium]|nr:SDR family NAD(P)-dependent oxidoreductase [Bacteroidales bacterium]